jgi:DNA-binding LacI/PurR family transcriptional regulator
MNVGFTAAYCTNTVIQFGVLQRLKRLGVDVPGDVSLIGNEYSELVKLSVPQLTAMLISGSQKELPVIRLIELIQRKRTDTLYECISEYELFPGGTLAACKAT